jgi:hypothetical protein
MTRHPFYLRIAFSATCGIACLLLIGLWVIAGCGGSTKPITPGEAIAISAAQKWLDSKGIDRDSVELSADQNGDGWSVFIERKPATAGGHTVLRLDAKGGIVDVILGR